MGLSRLEEPTRADRIDLGVPNQPPDLGIVGIAEGPSDLFSTDHAADADLAIRQLQLRVGLQRMHEIPSVQVDNDRRGILGPRLGEGQRKIGRAERRDPLPDEVGALGLPASNIA